MRGACTAGDNTRRTLRHMDREVRRSHRALAARRWQARCYSENGVSPVCFELPAFGKSSSRTHCGDIGKAPAAAAQRRGVQGVVVAGRRYDSGSEPPPTLFSVTPPLTPRYATPRVLRVYEDVLLATMRAAQRSGEEELIWRWREEVRWGKMAGRV